MDRRFADLSDHDSFADAIPYESFDRLRATEPVSWHREARPRAGFWAVVRHADVVAVSRDWRTFSSEVGHVGLEEPRPDELVVRRTMIDTDPPRHSHLRGFVNAGFTPRAMAAYEGFVRAITEAVLDTALGHGEFDFIDEIAAQVPIRVLVRLLGVPEADTGRMIALGDRMLANTDPDIAELVEGRDDTEAYRLFPFRSPAGQELWDYAHDLADDRRRAPRDDLVSRILAAEVGGERLSPAEFDNLFSLLVVAGNETTRQALASGVLALIEHPAELTRLRADPSLVPSAVEEVLRWSTPVFHFRRTATRDTTLGGRDIRAGDKVVVWYISANRDEAVFDDPYRFDVGRSPNDHVAFGRGGPHFCLGAHLARLEIRVVLEELLPRLSSIELAGPVRRVRSNFTNALKAMPVRVAVRS